MKLVSIAIMLLCCSSSNAFSIASFFKRSESSDPSDQGIKQDSGKNLFISPMLTRMSQMTKGAPVEFTPIPVIVGTKAELIELKKMLEERKDLPEFAMDFDPNVPDDTILSVPIGVKDLAGKMPVNDIVLPEEHPKNVTCETSVEELLPLLRQHPLPTLVHDSPEMILSMIQALVPKPDFFKSQPDIELLPSSKKLISLAVRNPDWVRALISAEPSILNDMLGLSSASETTSDDPSSEVA